jgi:hypothetical protein
MPKGSFTRRLLPLCVLFSSTLLAAQSKRLWVLRSSGDIVEYDAATFAEKQTLKLPAEAASAPQNLLVNHLGEMLFAPSVSVPLPDGDLSAMRKVWIWDGHAAATISRDVARTTSTTGSNLAITESAPMPVLSVDGTHLYWFSNQSRRLQRDGVDLSIKTTWQSWRTDLTGAAREEIASTSLPDCSCTTGACEESCPLGEAWVPDEGVSKFFLMTFFFAAQTQSIYKSTSLYEESAGHWAATPLDPPVQGELDAAGAGAILEAIPDTGCCGWSNESDDQTIFRLHGKTLTVFDERATYKNPDYDVSFYTSNGKLSPNVASVAMTINATAKPNTPIQLADDGQANPEESQRIRKGLLDLPAIEIKSVEGPPRDLAFLPHATLVGWINDKEILIVEDHLLVAYNIATAARRRSNVRVDDAEHVFLR